jgi:hypothetical protein
MRRFSPRRSFEVPRQQNQRRSQQRDDTKHMEAVHEGKQTCLLLQLDLSHPAVNEEFYSSDVAALIGSEKRHGLGDLFRSPEAAKGNCAR